MTSPEASDYPGSGRRGPTAEAKALIQSVVPGGSCDAASDRSGEAVTGGVNAKVASVADVIVALTSSREWNGPAASKVRKAKMGLPARVSAAGQQVRCPAVYSGRLQVGPYTCSPSAPG